MKGPEGKYAWMVKIGEKGQFVIPKEARDIFGLHPGQTILVLADETKGIRSGKTSLTVYGDAGLTDELWPIVREMVKTAIENRQNLVVEGCYIPFTWREDFGGEYLREIRCRWLVMTPEYIQTHFDDIRRYANAIETRMEDSRLRPEQLVRENVRNLELCKKYGCDYLLVDEAYRIDPGYFFREFTTEETL